MRFKAERVRAADIKPGDFFSFYDVKYWENPNIKVSVGQRAYICAGDGFIRGEMPTPKGDEDYMVTRVTVEQEAPV